MGDSILTTTKKVLSIAEADTSFDVDVLMHINSVFSTLQQLGIGPVEGFSIEDASPTWQEYLTDDKRFNMVRSYVYLKLRLIFDPPATSFHIKAIEDQIQEIEWRLTVALDDANTIMLPTDENWVEFSDSQTITRSPDSGKILYNEKTGDIWRVE